MLRHAKGKTPATALEVAHVLNLMKWLGPQLT